MDLVEKSACTDDLWWLFCWKPYSFPSYFGNFVWHFLLLCHVRKWNLCLSLLCGVVYWTPWCVKIPKKETVCVWTATWENYWHDNFIRRHVIGGLVLHLQIHLQNCGSLALTLCQLGKYGFYIFIFWWCIEWCQKKWWRCYLVGIIGLANIVVLWYGLWFPYT